MAGQTQANGYEANIFDPVHFYLEGDEFMQEDLRELCDSLVFDMIKTTVLQKNLQNFLFLPTAWKLPNTFG